MKKRRKLLAMMLSLAMAVTVIPSAPLYAAGTDTAVTQADEAFTGTNVAGDATPGAGYTNVQYSKGLPAINDGALATGETNTVWNSWGGAANLYPMEVTLTWSDAHALDGMRVMWWSDNGGVPFPTGATVEYLDVDGKTWNKIGDVGVEHGGFNGADGKWNDVKFQEPVLTTCLRMKVQRSGSGNNGVGISEWEAYGEKVTDEFLGVFVSGDNGLEVDDVKEYTGSPIKSTVTGVTYKWTVNKPEIAAIQGADNTATVKVKAIKAGEAVLKLDITKDNVTKSRNFALKVKGVQSIDEYQTTTAAGVAPILPDSVVAKGIQFDDPTPSLKTANNDIDLGETFESKLIPVTWDEVAPASYAANQIGKVITVNGKASYKGKEYDAVAKVTVKAPAAVAESNRSVTFENVQLNDEFWAPKQETNAFASLNKAILEIGKSSGGEPNFDNAIKKLNGQSYGAFKGFVFQDSDIYKSIEAISYTLSATQNDKGEEIEAQRKKLEDKLDSWISKIEQVQYADGYIDTHFTLRSATYDGGNTPGTHRWRDFSNHEMYNAGHFLEAVVAYTRYTEGIGKPDYRLYVAGKRFADHIVERFGPKGWRHEVPGHEEIELALVKFGKLAEEYQGEGAGQDYYDTAKVFVDRRGEAASKRDSGYKGYTYSQDQTPFVQETNAKGHSVRAGYFYAGVTDVATTLAADNTDRAAYLNSLDKIWDSVTYKKTYITGGIGTTAPSSDSEGFGDDYVLPNNQSYCEICAAISMANWNQRMNLLYEDGKYADSVEKNLYNAILVGTNLDGNLFYYSTLLEAANGNGRSEWFYCACCPPNLMRTIAALGGYMYTVHGDDVFVNLYAGSKGNVSVKGKNVELVQETNYPWSGKVDLTVSPDDASEFTVNVRIPGWVQEQKNKNVDIKVNGAAVTASTEKGYAAIKRSWKKGDKITIDIPMEIRKTEADPNVTTNEGRIALQRGPIVYSLEKAGNAQLNPEIKDFDPLNIVIPRDAKLKAEYKEDLLKGVVEITGEALYSLYGELIPVKIQAVPYYAWNNRGDDKDYTAGQAKNNSSKMLIWTLADAPQEEVVVAGSADDAGPSAKVSSDKVYGPGNIEGVHDSSFEPTSSSDHGYAGWSNWEVSRDDTPHWLMYEWKKPVTTKQMQIYWFEWGDYDRHPGTLKIQYKDASGNWQDVKMVKEYKGNYDKENQYNVIDFEESITSTAMRLLMTVNLEKADTKSIGVYRWKVMLDKDAIIDNVISMIDNIGEIEATIECKKTIYDVRASYESLSDEMKAKVTNADKLTEAEKDFEKAVADAAKPTVDLIKAIGTVDASDTCKAKIDAARASYDELSALVKSGVSNIDDLTRAEALYQALKDNPVGPNSKNLATATVTIPEEVYTYTGNKLLPEVTVEYDNQTLIEDTDYIVIYSNTKAIGTGSITVIGQGEYAGSQTIEFAIKGDVAQAEVKVSDQEYTGQNLTPEITVTFAGAELVKDTDYTIEYNDNKNVGAGRVVITGKGGYMGSKTVEFAIKGNISQAEVSEISAQEYTGRDLEPEVTVTFAGAALVKNTDYTVAYSDNKAVGTGTVVITGTGNYKGSKTVEFTIEQADISKAVVSDIPEQEYTGEGLTPEVTVTFAGAALVKDTDYTVVYSDNIEVGTGKAVITGKGNYKGSKTVEFTIKAKPVEKSDISKATVSKISAQSYTGKEVKPKLTVKYDGKTLKLNTDYTVKYSNNKNIGTGKAVITGKGNYTGTKTVTFSITVKKNASYTVGNYKYKITKADIKGKGTVALTGIKSASVKKKLKTISVPASVKIGGKSFAVTEIGSSAFSGCGKATSAVVGTKVTKIGAKAFYNCKVLKKITIKGTGLKSVGKNAFKGINKKATIKVPKKKLKAYKKILKSKGQKSSVKIK